MPKTKRPPKPAPLKQTRYKPDEPLASGEPSLLSKNIRELRLKRGWTYPAFREQTGVSEAMLKQIETGRRVPRLDVLCAIARALGTTASKLLEGVE